MNLLNPPTLLNFFLAGIEQKKAKPTKPKRFASLLILLFSMLSFSSFAQKEVILLNDVDTIDTNSILEIFSINEHLKFYHEKEMLNIRIAYKNPTGGFHFKEQFEKSGVINYVAIHLGTYKFFIEDIDSDYTCRCIVEIEFTKEGAKVKSEKTYHLNCWDSIFPNPKKPLRKL